jgi:hypothetical protein
MTMYYKMFQHFLKKCCNIFQPKCWTNIFHKNLNQHFSERVVSTFIGRKCYVQHFSEMFHQHFSKCSNIFQKKINIFLPFFHRWRRPELEPRGAVCTPARGAAAELLRRLRGSSTRASSRGSVCPALVTVAAGGRWRGRLGFGGGIQGLWLFTRISNSERCNTFPSFGRYIWFPDSRGVRKVNQPRSHQDQAWLLAMTN